MCGKYFMTGQNRKVLTFFFAKNLLIAFFGHLLSFVYLVQHANEQENLV